MMRIFQLIYTKVSPEESPWSKSGFHTIFYSQDLLTEGDVSEIEKKIYFPGTTDFQHKETVCYQKIKGKNYLLILHIRNLPGARDTYGRGGIFLCHGFIFPPEMWKSASHPLALFELVQDCLFKDREELLASPLVDKNVGHIQPLEISEDKRVALSAPLLPLTTDHEWKIAGLLNRFAQLDHEQRPTIVMKGKPETISSLMNKLIAYVPDEIKPQLGWDPAFDGGNVSLNPLKIVGYRRIPPRGRISITVDPEGCGLDVPEEQSGLLQPHTPYERWLAHCKGEANTKESIQGAWRLSLILEEKIPPVRDGILDRISGFATANRDAVQTLFLKRCAEFLGDRLASCVARRFTPESMFDLLLNALPVAELVGVVEEAIIEERVTPQDPGARLPPSLVDAGSYRMDLIGRIWRGEALRPDALRPMEEGERFAFMKYLLSGAWKEASWIVDLLKEDRVLFDRCLSSSETKLAIQEILLKCLRQYKLSGVEALVLREVLDRDRGFTLLHGRLNLMNLLEETLKRGVWCEDALKKLLSWAKGHPPPTGDYPFLKAALYPQQGNLNRIVKEMPDGKAKDTLLKCLILRNYKLSELEVLGFDRAQALKVKQRMKWSGLRERLKGFLMGRG